MTEEKKVVMSAEELWAYNDANEFDKFRGQDVERTEFDHKAANDFKFFAEALSNSKTLDGNVVHHYNGDKEYSDDDDPQFFDIVQKTN
ncbi:hypothetical protein TVAG_265740 [Trichomonas vaginalis G3]|uniref:Uncharacterized protein n=1 Tax=Trichomonas vaginalis (strain ATCC PRA-98 / G3) TaxID=412133 RepID=A2F2H1_TRIV3|nr:hypothetical protein TVAGG3_0980480 [Trichomonas vaginalis G3]EAY00871.1 hypothetical protein TVAG_265740 [Trichomonas vaginalis G3]KAI5489256.1 hypothetical protein TVAGG3_0980480 [Trichomonas vaginalis G3]|eukprot:XP_001313800.1 hypothetical protein [Trichomonas vaginalis G3]